MIKPGGKGGGGAWLLGFSDEWLMSADCRGVGQ